MMRTLVAGIFLAVFASTAFAQLDVAAARAAAGCGPAKIEFDVKTDKNQHPAPQPDSGKALVYVFEVQWRDREVNYLGMKVTTRVGFDGGWVGANHGESYFSFPLAAGDHRLCVDWQSNHEKTFQAAALTLTAEAGKVYYFRTVVDQRREQHQSVMRWEALDPAEAQVLIASSAFSTSHPKK